MANTVMRHELLDALWEVQDKNNFIAGKDIDTISKRFNISKIDLEGVATFYHFFHLQPTAKYIVYLNNSIVSEFSGFSRIKQAFETGTGSIFNKPNTFDDFALFETPCIGLCDMEPSALINFYPFINLTAQKIHQIINDIRAGDNVENLCDAPDSAVQHSLADNKAVFLRDYVPGKSLERLSRLSPDSIIELIKVSKLTGLGGAFFPVSIKWEACKKQKESKKYVVCNADEGEPGTFKDRHLLRHYPGSVLEGMIICGYAVGADEGIIYLRAEYRFLKDKLEDALQQFENRGLLGKDVCGIKGFDFKVRIQSGAGSYVCGEETAMLQSMEGFRGEPRPKIYFPVEKGFLGKPTVVNNVETLCAVSRILELGVDFYKGTGIPGSYGTKLISISGDCDKPGIYEVEWGITVNELLNLCGAADTKAVQMSGPSGELLSKEEFNKKISLTDLRCGGSFMVFNNERNILDVVQNFNQFFIDESCGVCTPCRAGNFILGRELKRIRSGMVDKADIQKVREWSNIMRSSSRCGLGKTAPNSIINGLDKFEEIAEKYAKEKQGQNTFFNLEDAVREYESAVKMNHRK